MLADQQLYADAPALVLRCPGCSGVRLRYGGHDGFLRLDLSGAALLVFRDAPE